MTEMTKEQVEQMRETLAAYDAAQAAASNAAEAARLLPVRTFCASDAYQMVLAEIPEIVAAFGDDEVLAPHVNCLKLGLINLAAAVGPVPPTASVEGSDDG